MNVRKKAFCLAAVLLALAVLLTCLAWLPMGGRDATPAIALETAAQSDAESGGRADDVTYSGLADVNVQSSAYKRYDFTGGTTSDFNAAQWSAQGTNNNAITANAYNISVDGYGVDIPADTGYATTRAAYVTANPMLGASSGDAFSIVLTVKVDGIINHHESMFGFMGKADPAVTGGDFFCVSGSGTGLHYNEAGTQTADVYYDIVDKSTFDMSDVSQYVLTMTDNAVKIYLNGQLKETYNWTANNVNTEYSRDTLQYIYSAEYFALGCADPYWGQADMTVKTAEMYTAELTQEQITAMYNSFNAVKSLDFSSVQGLIAQAEAIDATNYEHVSASGRSWYVAFADTLVKAQSTCYGYVYGTQEYVGQLVSKLNELLEASDLYKLSPDLTDGLTAAFPLDSEHGGVNIVTNSTEEADIVRYMTGANAAGAMTNMEALTVQNDSFETYACVEGAKLYEDEYVNDYNNENPYADRVATKTTMGLDIPDSAFTGCTAEDGVTVTVSVYAENKYSPFGRILQLGDYQTRASATGGQIFVATNGNAACDIATQVIMPNHISVCTLLARQWYAVSVVLDPVLDTIRVYITGYMMVDGAIEIGTTFTEKAVADGHMNTLISTIIASGAENWIGRSFWDSADLAVIGAASNLSVYDRALSAEEVGMLHATGDLSTLVAA